MIIEKVRVSIKLSKKIYNGKWNPFLILCKSALFRFCFFDFSMFEFEFFFIFFFFVSIFFVNFQFLVFSFIVEFALQIAKRFFISFFSLNWEQKTLFPFCFFYSLSLSLSFCFYLYFLFFFSEKNFFFSVKTPFQQKKKLFSVVISLQFVWLQFREFYCVHKLYRKVEEHVYEEPSPRQLMIQCNMSKRYLIQNKQFLLLNLKKTKNHFFFHSKIRKNNYQNKTILLIDQILENFLSIFFKKKKKN